MALEITPALSLLDEHHLLKEVVNEQKLTFENVTYDSRKVSDNTLFFCKGNFKPSYLTSALEKGATAYVSEQKYAEGMDARVLARGPSSHGLNPLGRICDRGLVGS